MFDISFVSCRFNSIGLHYCNMTDQSIPIQCTLKVSANISSWLNFSLIHTHNQTPLRTNHKKHYFVLCQASYFSNAQVFSFCLLISALFILHAYCLIGFEKISFFCDPIIPCKLRKFPLFRQIFNQKPKLTRFFSIFSELLSNKTMNCR